MLSIGVVSIGGERYYAKLANANYYTAGGEPPGRWWGQAAEALHLQGEVSAEDLSMLALGFSPSGSRPLVRNAGSTLRRAGFDLTFSAPKSVSVFWSQSDPASKLVGEFERIECRESARTGWFDWSSTQSEQLVRSEAVLASEFMSLPSTTQLTGLSGFYLSPPLGVYRGKAALSEFLSRSSDEGRREDFMAGVSKAEWLEPWDDGDLKKLGLGESCGDTA